QRTHRGKPVWYLQPSAAPTPAELTTDYLRQAYSGLDPEAIPKEILVDTLPADLGSLEGWLSQLRGSRVTVRVPERGEKKAVLETVTKNAKEALVQHKLKRSSDLTTRSQALKEIQEHLGLPEAPLRIECIDISH